MRGARTAALLIGVLAALLAAAGCGNSSSSSQQASGATLDSVLRQVKGLSGKERKAKLVALAAKEGDTVTLYTSQSASKIADYVSAFGDAYEDIDVAVYRANSETILPRLAEESKAGFHGSDVVQVQGLAMTSLHNDKLVADYASPERSELVPGAARDGWTVYSVVPFAVSWNTKLVPPGQVPKSWEDLADPKWKGKLGIEAGDVDWYKTLHDYFVQDQGKSEQEADRIFEGIARNALVVTGHTSMAQLMAAGELALSVNYSSTIDRLKGDGAPLAWRPPVAPLILEPEGTAPTADPAHPATALLLLDWSLSHDGQKAIVAGGSNSVRPELGTVPAAQTKLVDTAALAKDEQKWTDRWQQLLRLGKVAPSSG